MRSALDRLQRCWSALNIPVIRVYMVTALPTENQHKSYEGQIPARHVSYNLIDPIFI